jgi:predicted GNAT family N-acyltransferase
LAALVVTAVSTEAELQAALMIRRRVFVDEQQVPIEEEVDSYDSLANALAVHFLARLADEPIGTARLLLDPPPGEHPHIGRVSVLRALRGRGYGQAIMAAVHAEAQRRGYAGATLAAQLQALPFYARLGYVARGPVFLDAGIEHRMMDLSFG